MFANHNVCIPFQGEGIRDIADRFQAVTDMNRKAALRNARTAMTGAAGAGRLNSYRRAERHGIPLIKEWSANLDNVTRDSHVDVNGERREIEEEFSNGLMHPGGMGPPEEVYNCRCDLIAWVKGHEPREIKTPDRQGDIDYSEVDTNRSGKNDVSSKSVTDDANKVSAFSSPSIGEDFFKEQTERLLGDKEATEAFNNWSDTGSPSINRYMRGQHNAIIPSEFERAKKDSETMKRFISEQSLSDDIVVFRTIPADTFERVVKDGTYRDSGFTATSTMFDDVKGGVPGRESVWLEITVPKGEGRGAYINSVSAFKDAEHEYLIKSGIECKIDGSRNDKEGRKIYSLSMLGD